MIPTFIPALDAILGGGLPQGLVFLHGDIQQIARLRTAMQVPQDATIFSLTGAPPQSNQIVGQAAMHIKTMIGPHPRLILDTGDIDRTFMEYGVDVAAILLALRNLAISHIKPVSIVVEAHSGYGHFNSMADLILKADHKGTWALEKSWLQPPVFDGVNCWKALQTFDPFAEVIPVAAQPAIPVTVNRVTSALMRDPALAWEVAKRLRHVVGPWEKDGRGDFHRYNASKQVMACIYTQGVGGRGLVIDGGEPTLRLYSADEKTEADNILKAHGYVFVEQT